jgi:quercetin dioxygenase-like cupin family protein
MRFIFRPAIAGFCLTVTALLAQTPGLQRTVVHRADVSVPGREAVIVHVEMTPGGATGLHTHFGEEMSYVEEGEGELSIEGQPTLRGSNRA